MTYGYFLENSVITCCQVLDFTTEEKSIVYKTWADLEEIQGLLLRCEGGPSSKSSTPCAISLKNENLHKRLWPGCPKTRLLHGTKKTELI